MTRVRIFALVASLAALTIAFAACGDGGSDDPQAVIENANLEGVKSGTIDLQFDIQSKGKEGGDLSFSLSGPFQDSGKGDLPELALTTKANGTLDGNAVDFEGGLTLLSDRAFVNYKGTEYEVDPTTFGFLKSGFEQLEQDGGENSDEISACQDAVSGLAIGDFVTGLESEGSADVDGTSTTKVSGELNTAGAIDAVIKLTEDPACKKQLEAAGPLPQIAELEKSKGDVSKAVKKAHAEVYVGDDDIIRKFEAQFTVAADGETADFGIELTLGEVNEDQKISAPANAKPLEGLFNELGVDPLELLEGLNGGEEGLGDLLEGLTGSNEGTSEGSVFESSSGGSDAQQEYLECLQGAKTPTDLQKCASLLQ